MKRIIRKVAVLGSGVMGSRIACHFAGTGVQVLLLDRTPAELSETEKTKKLSPDHPAVKNRIVNEALAAAIKSNPSPVYTAEVIKRIQTGNFTDNMKDISACDWIIEVVVERLDIKTGIFNEVEKWRKPGTLVSSNTSGIPIHLMNEGRSDDFKKHFCGTHFFNPPRYLRLLEIIPTPDTDPEVVQFLLGYGDLHLGKTTVLCKDSPAFIANRVGVFSILAIFKLMDKLGLSIDQVEALTGPIIGRPKSATFRTADVVGLDTLVKVAKGVYENCPSDEARDTFLIPAWLDKMITNNWLGDKTGQGFFSKKKSALGEREIYTLQLDSFEYKPRERASFPGFGWEIGAFETWDLFGVAETAKKMEASGYVVASWVKEMLSNGNTDFYRVEKGEKLSYSPGNKKYISAVTGDPRAFIVMRNFENQTIWKNVAARLYHIGDEVLGLEWYTKLGTIGGEVLEGIQRSIGIAEEKYKGLVIANEAQNFSAGANVGMIFMLAVDQEFEELDMAVQLFQNTMMRARYSAVPVVVAPQGLTLGGACELSLHADKVVPAAESYIGLVELGVGLIPGGGGSKEFALRASDELHPDEPETITLKDRFFTIATARVSTSAMEAFDLGVLKKGRDFISINPDRRIADAKTAVLEMYQDGYTTPVPRIDIKVLGRSALGALYAGIHGMWRGNYATDHDVLVARKLAYVMCGGDLSEPTQVSEQYLLDLERQAFLSLCGEKKTLERLQSVIKSGKPVRN